MILPVMAQWKERKKKACSTNSSATYRPLVTMRRGRGTKPHISQKKKKERKGKGRSGRTITVKEKRAVSAEFV